jgi:TPR repeat protein
MPSPAAAEQTARTHLEQGRARIGAGDMTGAVTALRHALRLEPDLVEARASLGQALYGMGEHESAIDELRAALRQRPDLGVARLTLASALMARHDWAGARSELDEILKHDPDAVQATLGLASVRYAVGDIEGAIAAYRRALAREPDRHDARYSLALMLKLARRDVEATTELLPAAQAGIPRAQYFVGTAYAQGVGVEKNLATAIDWWFRAAEHGIAPAEEALTQLRLAALGRSRRPGADRQAAEQAFRQFRADLGSAFPSLPRGDDDTVGGALLRAGRASEAVPVLIREALALSEPAQRQLETLYEEGEGVVAAYDPRILAYFRTAAADGEPRPRLALARAYARGLGVPRDVGRAVSLLRATPHEEAQRLLQELSSPSPPPPTGR